MTPYSSGEAFLLAGLGPIFRRLPVPCALRQVRTMVHPANFVGLDKSITTNSYQHAKQLQFLVQMLYVDVSEH